MKDTIYPFRFNFTNIYAVVCPQETIDIYAVNTDQQKYVSATNRFVVFLLPLNNMRGSHFKRIIIQLSPFPVETLVVNVINQNDMRTQII